MGTTHPAQRRTGLRLALLALSAVALTACGGNAGQASSGASTAATTGKALDAEIASLTKPLDSYPVPSAAISGVASLKGKTVYYVPVTAQAPALAVTAKALGAALKSVGIKLQTCDGKGTPTDISACINQATSARAGAVIADSIAYGLAGSAFDAAQAAGVPVVISNQLPDDSHPASKTLAYVPPGGSQMDEALAKWIIRDSDGKAQVLINESVDGPSPAAYVAAGRKVYAQDCPDCKVTINKISAANFSLIPSSTSAAVLKDSEIGYVEAQFGQYTQATQAGVQQTSRPGIKVVVGAAGLSDLKAVANGQIAAAAGQSDAYQGWIDADAALRMMGGQSVPDYTIPVRLFTKDTMSDVTLTEQADASGEWFGPTTFTDDFEKLWGLT